MEKTRAIIITPFLTKGIRNVLDIKGKDFVICADNSFMAAENENISIDLIVGDFDSGKTATFPQNTEIMKVSSEKDDTDTMLCVKEAIKRGFSDIVIVGGIGGRLDHTFANIQTLYYGIKHGAQIKISDGDNEAFIMLPGNLTLEKKFGFSLSLFSYSENVFGLCEQGVKYPLQNANISNSFPLGVSNEIVSDQAKISFESGVLLIVISKLN